MAILGGNDCIVRANTWTLSIDSEYTLVDLNNTISSDGYVNSFCIHGNSAWDEWFYRPKILRINGADYDVIHDYGSWIPKVIALETINVGWSVLSGDIVACGIKATGPNALAAAVSGILTGYTSKYIASDVTTTTAIADFTDNNWLYSFAAHSPAVGSKFVDIATGNDSDSGDTWALAYLTVKKGIDNMTAGAELHIAEGDYSAQAVIVLNKNIDLVCEDYGGGNANPPLTVTLPATT